MGRSRGSSFAQAVAWTGGVKWLGQLLSWASTLIVARLLSPEDYGLVGMATVYLGIVTILSEFGLSTAIVANRDVTESELAQLNTLSLLIGVAAFGVSCLAAWPLGSFFGSPQLPVVVIVMSAAFLITAFRTVPYAVLQRDLEFRYLALAEGLQTVLLATTMVLLALVGFRYWTLVIGTLLGQVVSTLMLYARRPQGFAWPRFRGLGRVLTFSRQLVVGRLAWYASSRADVVVAGRVLGKVPLGEYSVAFTLASLPLEKVSALVNQVSTPFFSAVQKDRAALRHLLLTLTGLLAVVTFPVALGMALVADDFVRVVLGSKWLGVIDPLRILAAVAALRTITTLLPHVVVVTGGTRLSMYVSLAEALVVPAAFYVGSGWGVVGLASVWVLCYPVFSLPLYVRVFRRTAMSVREYLGSLWPAVSATALMSAAVLGARAAMAVSTPPAARFGGEIAVGALVYGLVLATWHRRRLLEQYRAFRRLGNQAQETAPREPARDEADPALVAVSDRTAPGGLR
jgi:O-antigen/teichoic acid export membrane protein